MNGAIVGAAVGLMIGCLVLFLWQLGAFLSFLNEAGGKS